MDTNILYLQLSQQAVLERQMSIIANNLANMNTTGYRSQMPMFEQYITTTERGAKISYPLDRDTIINTDSGSPIETGSPLDLAIIGNGYFQIETENGISYSRNGHFTIDQEGGITNEQGNPILDDNGTAISAQVTNGNPEILISRSGELSQNLDGANITLGRIGLVNFENPQYLIPQGGGLYNAAAGNDIIPIDFNSTIVKQGMLENSNVQPISELSKMIDTQRLYQETMNMSRMNNDIANESLSRLGKSRPR